MIKNDGILAIFPFLVVGSLPVAVMREMRRRGENVHVARYLPKAVGYTMDPLEDFAAEGRLIDMFEHHGPDGVGKLEEHCFARQIGMVVQTGSPWAYKQISRLKERLPDLKFLDMLYNDGPHFHSFAIYGHAFDAVLVESKEMITRLEDILLGATPYKVESGIDLERFQPGGRALLPPNGDLILGFVGRLSPEKNPLGFITCAERVLAALPWMRFAIFGQGPQEDAVRRRLEQSTVKDATYFGGFVDHPTQAFMQIDVLSVPSILDGRPAAIMEASACGVPVIGAPIGGIPELISVGLNGQVIAPEAVPRLIKQLEEWRADPTSFAQSRLQSRKVAEERFDRRRMMDNYHSVLISVLNSVARPLGRVAS